MTCIVALVEDGVTYFAGDSLVVSVPSSSTEAGDGSQTVRKEPKVWTRDGMVFGANGAVRMLQLLRYEMKIPPYASGTNKIAYLVTAFIPALQTCFADADYRFDGMRGNILLGLEGELFTIGGEFQVNDPADGYCAVGKGQYVAIGSLHTTATLKLPPKQRLYLALKAAERHTCVVSEPFTYITSQMEQEEYLTTKGEQG